MRASSEADYQQAPSADGRSSSSSRRKLISSVAGAVLLGASSVLSPLSLRPATAVANEYDNVTSGKITKTGVKYFDVAEGQGGKPQWGQMCSIK